MARLDLRHIDAVDGTPISAMPFLDELLSQELHDELERTLQTISTAPWLLATSLVGVRAITRVPLKPVALSEEEAKFDGLGLFRAVDLYTHNVVSREGLLQVLAEVQQLDGFGLPEHGRAGQYSLLMVDVASYCGCTTATPVWLRFGRTTCSCLGFGTRTIMPMSPYGMSFVIRSSPPIFFALFLKKS